MHSVVHGQAPSYILDIVTPVTRLSGRANLRSAHQGHYDVPRVATGLASDLSRALALRLGTVYRRSWDAISARMMDLDNIYTKM